jgi:hypothetical protein
MFERLLLELRYDSSMICDVEEEESLLLKTEDEEEDADIRYIRLLNYDEI